MFFRVPSESPPTPPGDRETIHYVSPLIRLQVWYISKAGRNFELTRALVQSLSKVGLPGWLIQPTSSTSLGKNPRDEFVPAEIDLQYQPLYPKGCVTPPEELMRAFFYDTLPPIIRDFFNERGKKAHYLTMFPLGDSVDRYTIAKYTQFLLLHPLVVDPDIVSGIMQQISHTDEYSRKLAYKRIGNLPLKSIQGSSLSDEWLTIGTWLARKAVTSGVTIYRSSAAASKVEAYAVPRVLMLTAKSQMQALYDKCFAALSCYRELETALDLDSKRFLEPNTMGSQDLYLIITQLAVAFQIVPFYRKERDLYMRQFFRSPWRIVCLVFSLVAFITSAVLRHMLDQLDDLYGDWVFDRYTFYVGKPRNLFWWKSSIAVCVFTLAIVLISIVQYGTLNHFNSNIDKKIEDLRVTQSALAAKFCVRVLKMPPEMMTMSERKAILHDLGVNFYDENQETQRRSLEAFLAKLV